MVVFLVLVTKLVQLMPTVTRSLLSVNVNQAFCLHAVTRVHLVSIPFLQLVVKHVNVMLLDLWVTNVTSLPELVHVNRMLKGITVRIVKMAFSTWMLSIQMGELFYTITPNMLVFYFHPSNLKRWPNSGIFVKIPFFHCIQTMMGILWICMLFGEIHFL